MKSKNLFRKTMLIGLVTSMLCGTFAQAMPKKVSAASSKQYFWSVLYDPDSKTMVSTVIEDDSKNPNENTYSLLDTTDTTFTITVDNGAKDLLDSTKKRTANRGNAYPYTFPGTITNQKEISGTSQDLSQANYVSSTLTDSFNRAMSEIVSTCGITDLTNKKYFELASKVYDSALNKSEKSYGSCTWKFTSATTADKGVKVITSGPGKGTSASDFVKLTIDGYSSVHQFSTPKGYHSGQYLEETLDGASPDGWMSSRLSWAHVLYQGAYNYKKNITTADADQLVETNILVELFTGLLNGLISGISWLLGLNTFDELILIQYSVERDWYKGIMPRAWFIAGQAVYGIALVVALVVIAYAVVKLMIQKNLSTINASQRISLMEGIKDLFVTAAMLALFYPAFLIVCQFNFLLVKALEGLLMSFSGGVGGTASFQGSLIGVAGLGLGSLIVSGVVLFLVLKINIHYLMRAITILLLFGTAPYFISTFSIPGKKNQFFSWLKELLANIFMQTFDAILLVIYVIILHSNNGIGSWVGIGTARVSLIARLVMAFAFFPLSSFFKQSVMNLGTKAEDAGDHAAGVLGSSVANLGAGVAIGLSHNKNTNASNGGGNASYNAESTPNVNTSEIPVQTSNKGVVKRTLDNIRNVGRDFDPWSETGKANAKTMVGAFGKGVKNSLPHIASAAAYTGLQMGAAAIGGHSFMAERGQALSMSNAQDAFWDDGVAKGFEEIQANRKPEPNLYTLNDLNSGGIDDIGYEMRVDYTEDSGFGNVLEGAHVLNLESRRYNAQETERIAKAYAESGENVVLGIQASERVTVVDQWTGKPFTQPMPIYKNVSPGYFLENREQFKNASVRKIYLPENENMLKRDDEVQVKGYDYALWDGKGNNPKAFVDYDKLAGRKH